jgi:hypothetical protein
MVRGYIEAMGGKLRLVAEFPDRPPVLLAGLQGMAAEQGSRRKREGATGQAGFYFGFCDLECPSNSERPMTVGLSAGVGPENPAALI